MAFVVFEILRNLVSMLNFLNANNSETFKRDFNFIFDVLSESLFGFVSYSVFQAVENVVSFTKKRFYRKRGSVTMRNYAETFQANHGYNMV